MKSLSKIAALLSLLATPAAAADLGAKDYDTTPLMPVTQWTGLYLGASIGAAATIGTVDAGIGANNLTIDGLGAQGVLGSVTVGYDYHAPMSKFVAGPYASYAFGAQTWELSSNFGLAASAELTNQWSAGLKGGYLLTAGILTYAKFGYAGADLNVSTTPTLANVKSPSFKGWELGTGVEMSMGNGLFVNSEYTYTSYRNANLYDVGGINVGVGVDEHRFMTGFVYKIGQSSQMPSYK
jgi:opacity protein-like surface antigen